MKAPLRIGVLLTLALVGGSPTAAHARSIYDCLEGVIADCAEAMDGARWYERVALGVLCSALLAGCTSEALK